MEKFKYVAQKSVSKLPDTSGIYSFYGKGRLLYIGKATNIKERVKNHFQQPSYKDNLFINKTSKIGYQKTDSEIEALLLEAKLIKKHQPRYNVVWRDDKNYFYVAITKEEFPKVFITHQTKLKNLKTKADFLGPFVDGKALKETLKSLRKTFPFRSCNVLPKRPCLWYQLNRCPAPCLTKSKTARQIPTVKSKIKREVQENARNLSKVLEGKKVQVLSGLKREMKKLSKEQRFEEAAGIRNRIRAFDRVLSHARIFEDAENLPSQGLKEILGSEKDISKIEAYDISNIQGKEATGSMVTFVNSAPKKEYYRKFKIRAEEKPNDVAMIKEVLTRRLKHKEWPLPDLILIDGGKAQLNAAKSTLAGMKIKGIKVAALAKRKNELFTENRRQPILLKTLPREAFNLILQLRDEAHRFAIAYHRKLRKKSLLGF